MAYVVLLGMPTVHKRFPRAVLFARAASMQGDLEKWMGETAIELDELGGRDINSDRTKTLKVRHESLRNAWLSIKDARQRLYECP
jgi:hypothetical protein